MPELMILILSLLPSQPATSRAADDESHRAVVSAAAKDFSVRCEFRREGANGAKLQLHPAPLLRWSNPTAGEVYGEVFVWTDNGRPLVIASWYRWFRPDWGRTLEVCSVSSGPLSGQVAGQRFWNPVKPGLTLKPIANAEAPAKSPAGRLVQMRRLAGDFNARLTDTRGDQIERQLRQLTQPVFRYPNATDKSTYLDGAIFAFVEGTDPELFLMLEAIETESGSVWHYGLVRMNSDALVVTYRNENIWSVPKLDVMLNNAADPYALITSEKVLKEPAADLPAPGTAPKLPQ